MKFFITGGTGSLGSRIVKRLLLTDHIIKHDVVIFSRDEQKQYKMKRELEPLFKDRLQFIVGDVRDKNAVVQALRHTNPDYIIHTAAQKHVRICDENPEQAVLTNINGTINVCEAAEQNGVKICCIVSTDKAVEPTTLYGMTKAIAEKIISNRSRMLSAIGDRTKFVGVRYGNVINSAGSLIPSYMEHATAPEGERIFPLTDGRMTRFFITFDQAIDLIFYCMELDNVDYKIPNIYKKDGVFMVPKLRSAKIGDLANIYAEKYSGKVIDFPIYPGEKFHEQLSIEYSSDMGLMSKEEIIVFLEKEGLLP